MSLRAILTRRFRFPPCAPAARRSLHSLRDLAIGNGIRRGAAGVAAAALAGGGTLAAQYFKNVRDEDDSAARKKEEDMKARFEGWMKQYNKSYKDEEEKAMRFQRFKATIKWMESQERFFPNIGYYADSTEEEQRAMMSCPDGLDMTGYIMLAMEIMANKLAVHYSKKGTSVDESASPKKDRDMQARFGVWMKENNKFYRDKEEKAMRFQRFMATVNSFSTPPETLNYFADWTDQEMRKLEANPGGLYHDEEYENIVESVLAKGGSVMVIRDVMKGGTQAARDVKKGDTQAARDVKKGGTHVSV